MTANATSNAQPAKQSSKVGTPPIGTNAGMNHGAENSNTKGTNVPPPAKSRRLNVIPRNCPRCSQPMEAIPGRPNEPTTWRCLACKTVWQYDRAGDVRTHLWVGLYAAIVEPFEALLAKYGPILDLMREDQHAAT